MIKSFKTEKKIEKLVSITYFFFSHEIFLYLFFYLATKCRLKKKEMIKALEQKEIELSNINFELRSITNELNEEYLKLRQLLLLHVPCKCDMIQEYLRKLTDC